MPFGLPSVASTHQRNVRQVLAAQEARFHAVPEEMATAFREPPELPEPPEAQVAHEESFLQRVASAAPALLHLQTQVTSSKFI